MQWRGFSRVAIAIVFGLAPSLGAADIHEWEWNVAGNPSQGKYETTIVCPDGAGVSALPEAHLASRDLTKAYLIGADLTNANLLFATLTNADLTGANLDGANFFNATLPGSMLVGVTVRGANFGSTTSKGFTAGRLYSTASYQSGDISGIGLEQNNLTGWNFLGKNLTGARLSQATLSNANLMAANLTDVSFSSATLTMANLDGATITGADFSATTSKGFTAQQLYRTASYYDGDLRRIGLGSNDLTGWDFNNVNLADANFSSATLTNANFTEATVSRADFSGTGLSAEQLYDTVTYQSDDLSGIKLGSNDLTDWSFDGMNLSNASFSLAILTGANLTFAQLSGASFVSTTLTNANLHESTVNGADFSGSTLTSQQLYDTASYRDGDLSGIKLASNDLSDWNFAERDLSNADLSSSILAGTSFYGANLTNANLSFAMTGAIFADATVKGVDFSGSDIIAPQLYFTASYQSGDLRGIKLRSIDLTGWNLAGMYLADGDFALATLTDANLTGADLRGATGLDATGANMANTIQPDGTISRLALYAPTASLVVRDYDGTTPMPIRVTESASLGSNAHLQVMLEDATWGSTISFEPDIPVTLDGQLSLGLAPNVNPAELVGASFRLFDWTGVNPTGGFAVSHDVPPGYSWMMPDFYTTGIVTLVARIRDWRGTGPAANAWSYSANWSTSDTFAPTDLLYFGNTQVPVSHNDLEGQQVAGLRFGEFADALQLTGNALKIAGTIDDQSTIRQEIDLPIEFVAGANSGTVNVVLGGELQISQPVGGDRGLTKTGLGTLELTEDVDYTGDTDVQAGMLVLRGLSNGGSTTVSGTLLAQFIHQESLTIHAGGVVEIVASGMDGGPGTTGLVFQDVSPGFDTMAASAHSANGAAAVPEPATWWLIAISALTGMMLCMRVR